MARSLSGMLDRVEDELFELAEKSPERDVQNIYLDARSQARQKRDAIEATFRRHFLECFDRKVRGEASGGARPLAAGELTLVAHEDLEESIAVSEMSRKLQSACEAELFALRQRMGFLLERPELDDESNPMSPATICAALKDACDQIEADFKVRMALLRQLERHAEAELVAVYHDLNAHLVSRRIMPEVRPLAAKRAAASPTPVKKRAEPAPAPGDLFAAFAAAMAASQAAPDAANVPAMPGMAPVIPMPSGTPAAAGAGPAAQGNAPFVEHLTRLHREAPEAPAEAGASPTNVVRGLKASAVEGSLAPIDAMTIDLVAMLFDYVFEDRHIPATVKALLGRLQIPTLKVALLDRGFFTSKGHPARRLIDLLAEASMGLDESAERSSAALAMVEGVVEGILREFDTDVALFEAMAARVAAFIEEQEHAEADLVQRSARVIEAREREQIARLVGEEEVTRRLQGRAWIPAAVREMLQGEWTRAFASVQLAEGEGSPAWQSLVYTMDDLLWSVEPKVSAEDRKRLVTMLPGLLRQLQYGMRRAGMVEAKRDEFLAVLVDCHASAVKAGLRGLAAVPEAPVPEPEGPAVIEREILPAGDVQVEEIRLRQPRGTPVRNVFTRTGIWTHVQRGTWVEFRREASALRARLTWISPNKGVYLFTNPASGAIAVSISPDALAEQMRLGEARILDDAPLVDRAVDSMLATLRQGAPAQG
jgi:hypothetical protein